MVGRKNRDQLDLQRDARHVARHGAHQSQLGQPDRHARRNDRDAGRESDQRLAESFEHQVDVEQPFHVIPAEIEQLTHAGHHRTRTMWDFLRNGKLVTLMLGHLTVDSYVGVIPVLYPLLIGRFHLTLGTVGLVSLAYSGMAAISQPLFGVIADRYGTRFTGVALGWTALTFALVGFVPTFPLLLVLACASGLGSGAFHPFGALDVRALLPAWRRSLGMSIYVTAGNRRPGPRPLIRIRALGPFGRLHRTGLAV